MVLAPEPAWRGIAGRARSGRSGRALAVGGAVIAAGVASVALAGPALNGSLSVLDAATVVEVTPTASALPEATPRSTATPRPTPLVTATPEPTAEPTPEPTPEPTIAPTPAAPAPPPQQTYVVQEGDTLAEIAQTFGTTVEALQAANDIEDPNQIIIGQVLVIP